jgi:alpha-beta hydrolase superfamily lysophospholipase
MKTSDGLTLHTRHWRAPSPALGTAVLVHGLGEHIGRYEHVAEHLTTLGWDVRGFDHRGHGRSGGRRGDIARPDSLLHDLGDFLDEVRRTDAARPLVLIGHSLGGLVVARFVAESVAPQPAPWSRSVDGVVLSSPAIDPGLHPVQKALLAVAPRILPHLCVNNGLRPEWICNDPAVVQAYLQDPLVHDRISGLLGRFIADAGPLVLERASGWPVPTLLMWSGQDRCVSPVGSERLAQALPAGLRTVKAFPALAHEILNERERGAVLALLGGWLRATFGAGMQAERQRA